MGTRDTRGVLYPAALPTFVRHPAAGQVDGLVRWFWISQWDIAPGRSSRQRLLAFPALNLVVEDSVVGLSGPTTTRSHRDLVGRGWAVGALLRPAATPIVCADPGSVRDTYQLLDLSDLQSRVDAAMPDIPLACKAFEDWLVDRMPELTDEGLLANRLVAVIDEDPEIVKVEQAAAAVNISVRTAQRLCRRYVGLSPLAMIRRRRLQDAASWLREDPSRRLADIATELGYADEAHMVRDFREVLDFTPGQYRRSVEQTG